MTVWCPCCRYAPVGWIGRAAGSVAQWQWTSELAHSARGLSQQSGQWQVCVALVHATFAASAYEGAVTVTLGPRTAAAGQVAEDTVHVDTTTQQQQQDQV